MRCCRKCCWQIANVVTSSGSRSRSTSSLRKHDSRSARLRLQWQRASVWEQQLRSRSESVLGATDETSVWWHDQRVLKVAENSPLMTAVLRVKATDADSRENGKVFYRITNGSSVSFDFCLNPRLLLILSVKTGFGLRHRFIRIAWHSCRNKNEFGASLERWGKGRGRGCLRCISSSS